MTRRDSEAGLTLVELMVSLVILSIAVAAALGLGYSIMNSYRDLRRSTAVERAARGSIDVIADALRMASPGVSNGNIIDGVDCDMTAAIDVVNYNNAPDELKIIYASGGQVTTVRSAFSDGDTEIDVFDDSGFIPGDTIVVTNAAISTPTYTMTGHLLQVADKETAGDNTIDVESLCSSASNTFPAGESTTGGRAYGPGSLVVRARKAHFYVDSSNAAFLMDPGSGAEPLALGIDDVQLAVGADSNDDGEVSEVGSTADDDEWYYNVSGESGPPSITVTPWSALRISLVARSTDESQTTALSSRPALEDRPAGTADESRRRIVHAVVQIRNLGDLL